MTPCMDIYGPSYRKVIYTGENGYDWEHVEAKKIGLVVGHQYTVLSCEIGQSRTTVRLKEFPGAPFNSVIFRDPPTALEIENASLQDKIKVLEHLLTFASRAGANWQTLMDTCGHYRDGSDEVVKFLQDDATRTYIIAVGSGTKERAFVGASFEDALTLAAMERSTNGAQNG